MNTKGIKFLAVLAVMVMAFAAIAVIAPNDTEINSVGTSTSSTSTEVELIIVQEDGSKTYWTDTADIFGDAESVFITAKSIELYDDLIVTENLDTHCELKIMKKGLSITVNAGVQLDAKVTYGSSSLTVEKFKATAEQTAVLTAGSVEISGYIDDNLVISEVSGKVILKDVTVAEGKKITIADDQTVHVQGMVTGAIEVGDDATLSQEDGGDLSGATITGTGDVVKNVDETKMAEKEIHGDIAPTTQGTPLDYSASQLVVVDGDCTLLKDAQVYIRGALIIPEGKKLTVSAGAELRILNDADVHIEGTLEIEEINGSATTAGLLNIVSGNVDVTGKLYNNGTMTLTGNSTFPAEVTINAGAVAIIDEEGSFATTENSNFNVKSGAELTVNGKMGQAINNSGSVYINSMATAANNTTINMLSSEAFVDVQNYTVDAADLKTLTISDANLVFTSYRDDDGNDHDVILQDSANTITIAPSVAGDAVPASTYSATFGGLQVATVVSFIPTTDDDNPTAGIYNERQFTKSLDIEGILFADATYIGTTTGDDKVGQAIVTTGTVGTYSYLCSVLVSDEITINDKVTVSNGANMIVSGDIYTTSNDATFRNTGSVYVIGAGSIVSVAKVINSENGVSAAKFVTTTTGPSGASIKVYNYLSIDGALAVAELISPKEIIVLGTTQVMTVDAELPEPVALVLDNSAAFTVDEGVFFTVENGSAVKGAGTIYVDGTMYAQNKSNVKSGVNVISDVKTEELDEKGRSVKDGWAMWTNLASAVQAAQPGDEITVTKSVDEGLVILSDNLIIPEGITVIVPDGTAGLLLLNGVTLTVDGLLFIEANIYAEQAFGLTAQNLKMQAETTNRYSSAVVVNGAIVSAGVINYGDGAASAEAADITGAYADKVALIGGQYAEGKHITFTAADPAAAGIAATPVTAPIAGAYYQIKEDGTIYYVISNLNYAMSVLDDVQTNIAIFGEVAALAIDFEGTDYCNTITIMSDLGITAPTSLETGNAVPTILAVLALELDGAKLFSQFGGSFTGLVGNEDATISFTDVYGMTVQDKEGVLYVYGAPVANGAESKMAIAEGVVLLGMKDNTFTFTGTATKNMKIDKDAVAIVEQTTVINYLNVAGTFAVPSNKTATVTGTLTVSGTIAVDEATSSTGQGTLNMQGTTYIGITSTNINKGQAASTAILSGPFTTAANNWIYVSAGTNIDAAAALSLAALKSTTFVVDGKEWYTAFNKDGNQTLGIVDGAGNLLKFMIPVENARCYGWATKEGGTAVTADPKVGANANLYAIIGYNIYNITIYTDAGVKSVAIDNIELYNNNNNSFVTVHPIDAGVHTVSFTLKDGYEGVPNLYTNAGTILKDYKFTVSGTPEGQYNLAFDYQLYGTEKEEVAPAPTPEEESQWTVTTILLVILVVLIAIMAVIVALRLNRS